MDLRPWGLGWHYRLGPESLGDLEAVHLAWSKLTELRAPVANAAPAAPPSTSPATFAAAIGEWKARKQYDTPEGREYSEKTAELVTAELGGRPLAAFEGAAGDDLLLAYLAELQGRGLAARTVCNRFSIVGQVLRLVHGRRWLAHTPTLPPMPRKPPPRYEWIDEVTFRAVRDQVLARRGGHKLVSPSGEPWEVWVCRRRCFLSLMFYLGLHPRDAGEFNDANISLDGNSYVRVNTKSALHVPVEQFDEVPEPLVDDLRELLALLGRDAFYCGELVGGGPWPHCDRQLARAQRELGIPGARLNTRVLRRSWVRMMRLLGYTEEETAARAGHADTKMIHEVYVRIPRPVGAVKSSRWKRTPRRGAPTSHAGARVVPFRRPQEGDDDAST